MKRYIALLLCLVLTVSAFAGCSRVSDEVYIPTGSALVMEDEDPDANVEVDDGRDQELSLAYYADRSMNPLISTNFTNRALFSLIYQGLFSIDRNYEAVPILCGSFQVSPDNRIYSFYLDERATFSDGTRVTIEDVIATYNAAKSSKYYSGRFTHIHEVKVSPNGLGVTFYLTTPYESLPLLLDIPILKASELEADHPLGTGPYIFSEQIGGAYLHRLESWWCQDSPDLVVTAASIPLVEGENAAHIRDEFEFGDLGLVCADPCTYSYADFRCDFELWDCDNGYFLYLGMNVNYSEKGIFENSDLRSKLTYAIDRELLSEKNFRGYARPATLAADPNSPFYSEGLAQRYAYDPMKFVDTLGKYLITKPVRLLVNSDDRLRLQTARDIAQMLTEHGMTTVTVEMDSEDYEAVIRRGEYDMYLGRTRLSANQDLSNFFRAWGSGSYNGVVDEESLKLCLAALANRGNYYDLHEHVAEDARIVPILFYGYAIYGTRGLLSDLRPSRDNVFFYSLDKTLDSVQIPTDYGY